MKSHHAAIIFTAAMAVLLDGSAVSRLAAWWNKSAPVFLHLPEMEIKPVIPTHKQTLKPPTGEKL